MIGSGASKQTVLFMMLREARTCYGPFGKAAPYIRSREAWH